jgi:hypothetical protein
LTCIGRLRHQGKTLGIAPYQSCSFAKLMAMGFVELRNDDPALTNSGLE